MNRLRVHAVEGGELLPRLRAADDDRACQRGGVERVQRLPGREHHIVGHIDGQRDRPHAGLLEPVPQPVRGGPGRVDAAHDPGDVPVAADDVADRRDILEPYRPAGAGSRGDIDGRRVTERRSARQGVLTGDPADGEAVAAIGGHVDVEDLVVQPQQGDRVVAGFAVQAEPVEHDDAGVVVAEPQFLLRADHPRRRRARRFRARRWRSRRAAPRRAGRRRRGHPTRSCGRRRRSRGRTRRSRRDRPAPGTR